MKGRGKLVRIHTTQRYTEVNTLFFMSDIFDTRVLVPFSAHVLTHSILKLCFPSLPHLLVEKIPSTLNSILVSCLVINEIQSGAYSKDVINPYPANIDRAFASQIGFTLYDLLIMTADKHHSSIWSHHLIAWCHRNQIL